ncbi:hypothetical protein BsWGS_21560 [Bradybaena similaris]
MMFRRYQFVIALSLLWILAEESFGDVRDDWAAHRHDKFSKVKRFPDKTSQGAVIDISRRKLHGKITNSAANYARRHKMADTLNDRYKALYVKGFELLNDHWINPHRDIQPGVKYTKGHNGRVWALTKPLGAHPKLRTAGRREVRVGRAAPSKRPSLVTTGGIRLPQGITYTWTRDVGTGRTYNEAGFKAKDKNLVVILSFDDALKDANLTASATLYDFTGTTGVMAIKPRVRPGPCFMVDTSLTFDKIVADLNARNGSSVSTSTVVSLDGTGNPVSFAERQAMLEKTPSLSRQCRGREIIRTKRKGFSPIPYVGPTEELKLLAMDVQLSITVPVELDLEVGPFSHWFEAGVKGPGHVKDQGHWIRQ